MNNITERKPRPPFPAQTLTPPGLERDMKPKPRYQAPAYRAAGKLIGQVALITGGDSGIGRSVAVLFAREGADVAIIYLPEEAPDARVTQKAVEAEGQRALLLPGDVSVPEFCAQAVEQCVEEFGKLSILVNNAAVQQHRETVEELTAAAWRRTFDVNINGYFYMVQGGPASPGRGRGDSQHGFHRWTRGKQGIARLFEHQGRDSRLHQVVVAGTGRTWHSRELRGAWPGVDAAESGGARR